MTREEASVTDEARTADETPVAAEPRATGEARMTYRARVTARMVPEAAMSGATGMAARGGEGNAGCSNRKDQSRHGSHSCQELPQRQSPLQSPHLPLSNFILKTALPVRGFWRRWVFQTPGTARACRAHFVAVLREDTKALNATLNAASTRQGRTLLCLLRRAFLAVLATTVLLPIAASCAGPSAGSVSNPVFFALTHSSDLIGTWRGSSTWVGGSRMWDARRSSTKLTA
jgi:hypothetical protein